MPGRRAARTRGGAQRLGPHRPHLGTGLPAAEPACPGGNGVPASGRARSRPGARLRRLGARVSAVGAVPRGRAAAAPGRGARLGGQRHHPDVGPRVRPDGAGGRRARGDRTGAAPRFHGHSRAVRAGAARRAVRRPGGAGAARALPAARGKPGAGKPGRPAGAGGCAPRARRCRRRGRRAGGVAAAAAAVASRGRAGVRARTPRGPGRPGAGSRGGRDAVPSGHGGDHRVPDRSGAPRRFRRHGGGLPGADLQSQPGRPFAGRPDPGGGDPVQRRDRGEWIGGRDRATCQPGAGARARGGTGRG